MMNIIIFCLFRLSPEVHLKRPVSPDSRYRLDKVLQRKAVCLKLGFFEVAIYFSLR
jgi:hypothetical protein